MKAIQLIRLLEGLVEANGNKEVVIKTDDNSYLKTSGVNVGKGSIILICCYRKVYDESSFHSAN